MGSAATVGASCNPLAQCMITIEICSKRFGSTPVLGVIDLQIAPGETVALTGPSGVGKSTLLRILAGIDLAFEGQVTRPEAMAVVFQEPTLLPWRSVLDNLLLIHPMLTEADAMTALDRVGLQGKDALFPGQLSLGQQRRLSLARAFAGQPELLVMDEPFVSLDEATAHQMLDLTKRLVAEQGCATLFVTHALSEAKALADRILHLEPDEQGSILRLD